MTDLQKANMGKRIMSGIFDGIACAFNGIACAFNSIACTFYGVACAVFQIISCFIQIILHRLVGSSRGRIRCIVFFVIHKSSPNIKYGQRKRYGKQGTNSRPSLSFSPNSKFMFCTA